MKKRTHPFFWLMKGGNEERASMSVKFPHQKTAKQIWVLLIAFIFLSAFIIASACATPPPPKPPEYGAAYLLPHLGAINISERDSLIVTNETVPVFLNLSPYYSYQAILDEKTGEHAVSEVWYFDNWTEFTTQRALLLDYLSSHGTVSNATLDISPEISRFAAHPAMAGSQPQQLPVLEYESNITSGYFIIFSTDFFSGNDYYIAYYGLAGSTHLDEQSTFLKTLIMSAVPVTLNSFSFEFNPSAPPLQGSPYPSSPPPDSSLQTWTLIFLVFVGIPALFIVMTRESSILINFGLTIFTGTFLLIQLIGLLIPYPKNISENLLWPCFLLLLFVITIVAYTLFIKPPVNLTPLSDMTRLQLCGRIFFGAIMVTVIFSAIFILATYMIYLFEVTY